jgi:DNA-binding transcriptional MocR family regulator
MLQTILFDLLTESDTVDQVALARRTYRERQVAMADALRANGWDVATADGINLWLEVDDERDAVVQLAAAGIRVAAGTPFLSAPGGQFIRVTAGQVRDDFAEVGAQLAAAGAP